ncbi:unnamed protein product [Rhizopus stolonifer]
MNRFLSLSVFTTKYTLTTNPFRAAVNVKRAFSITGCNRNSDVSTKTDLENSMNQIEELFSTAKDELECAEESQGTTYYHEDKSGAEKAVSEVLNAYDTFLLDLPSDEMRNEVQTKVGMKMKELKMTFDSLPEEGH